ncbi:hypothetical protein EMF73_34070 [Klebsiella pneumoniae]|nr:hypothetical protein EMF73_34070 [Klebsiella pneumoniae]
MSKPKWLPVKRYCLSCGLRENSSGFVRAATKGICKHRETAPGWVFAFRLLDALLPGKSYPQVSGRTRRDTYK